MGATGGGGAGMIGGITSTAMGTVGGIFSAIAGIKWDKQMKELQKLDPAYKISPYAQDTLGLAKTLLNGRMAGATEAERNIMANKASTVQNINNNATDASQALALAAGAGAQADAGFQDLSTKEQQDYLNRLNNLNKSNSEMTDEYHNQFDDQVRRWQDQVNISTAQYKARKQGGSDVAGWGAGLSGMGGGGMGGSGGGGGQAQAAALQGVSDKRLKHSYHIVGKSASGINIYEFSYLGSYDRYIGVMADEVPQASFVMPNGFLAVDYSKIDVPFKMIS